MISVDRPGDSRVAQCLAFLLNVTANHGTHGGVDMFGVLIKI